MRVREILSGPNFGRLALRRGHVCLWLSGEAPHAASELNDPLAARTATRRDRRSMLTWPEARLSAWPQTQSTGFTDLSESETPSRRRSISSGPELSVGGRQVSVTTCIGTSRRRGDKWWSMQSLRVGLPGRTQCLDGRGRRRCQRLGPADTSRRAPAGKLLKFNTIRRRGNPRRAFAVRHLLERLAPRPALARGVEFGREL